MKEAFFSSLGGVPTTLALTFITMLFSIPLGFFMAKSRLERKKVAGKLVTGYVSVIRGTPVVLQILFLYSLLPSFLNYLIKDALHLDFNIFKVNPILYAFLVFILNNTAVLSEVFRSALMTVNHGQMEAALSIGLNRRQAYTRIILPQAAVAALPNVCNSAISLLKSTSLAFMMSVQDITAISKMKAAAGYNYIEAYLMIALIYIIVCTIVQILFQMVEARLSTYKKLVIT
jgi:L-cystine transport system permease protein